MLIKVEKNFVNEVLRERNEDLVNVLRRLLWAIQFGKHIVFFEISDYERLIECSLLGNIEKALLNKAKKKNYQIKAIISEVNIICHITTKEKTRREDENIYINPTEYLGFNFEEETHLITENLSDARFFVKYILSNYQRNNKTRNIATNFFGLMGGGSTIGQVIKQEVELKQHFAFAITDSDKKYPTCSKKGDTCMSVEKELEKEPFNCGHYIMQNVMEVENLLPLFVVLGNKELNEKNIEDSILNDWSYFDMKKGLYVSNEQKYNSYWNKNINDPCILNIFETACKSDSKECVIEGFGEKVLSKFLKLTEKKPTIFKDEDLSDNQKKEWENIGKHLISWCCCFSKTRC
ncbi:hypothetical protein [Prevotella nigrescens]